jgi:hypothetical protein
MNIAQSIYDDLVNECGASFDVDADVVRAIIAVSVSGVLNAQIKHTAELEKQLAIAQGALRAQDENHRAQLAALGLTERFPSLTHLADDMGEALLRAEKQITEIKQLLDLHCIHFSEIDPVERVKAVR